MGAARQSRHPPRSKHQPPRRNNPTQVSVCEIAATPPHRVYRRRIPRTANKPKKQRTARRGCTHRQPVRSGANQRGRHWTNGVGGERHDATAGRKGVWKETAIVNVP